MPEKLDFLTLITEMRWSIYDFVFVAELDDAQPLDVLLSRVPGAAALRTTCKFIYNDSKKCYIKAEAVYNKRRQAITHTLIQNFQYIEDREDINVEWQMESLYDLSQSLVNAADSVCKHECRKALCYMCDDPAHRQCFDCGRNAIVALYCRLHTSHILKGLLPDEAKETVTLPMLIVPTGPTTSQKYTPMGRVISRLELTMTCAHALRSKNIRGYTFWAYRWWHGLLTDQRALDTRCAVRRFAVRKHWDHVKTAHAQGLRVPDFCEANIRYLESHDRRMALIDRMRYGICKKYGLTWRDEYERRVKVEAESEGVDVALLMPSM